MVVSPLSSIIKDQISVLTDRGIRAASLPNLFEEKKDDYTSLFPSETPDEEQEEVVIAKDIIDGNIDVLFGHPESFLSEHGREILKSAQYKTKAVACVFDEAHCINLW